MVSIRVLDSISDISRETNGKESVLDAAAIEPIVSFTGHIPPSDKDKQIIRGSYHGLVDCRSAIPFPDNALERVYPFTPFILDEDSLLLPSQLDRCGSNRQLNVVDEFDNFSDIRSNDLRSSKPLHVEMVDSYQRFMMDMGTEEERSKLTRLIQQKLYVRGLKMLDIRYKLHHWYREWESTHGSVPEEMKKNFAFLLMESEWYEDKVAAVLFIQEVLIANKSISHVDLPRFKAIFQGGHITVYKICDHFASKILCYLAEQNSKNPSRKAWILSCLFEWAYAEDLWQARAAMFALAAQAKKGFCPEKLMISIQHILMRAEDEAKSIAGAALRSISEKNPGIVVEFLMRKEIIANMSAHALRKATSRLNKTHRDFFNKSRRQVRS